jgi:hypothetical protein
VIRLARSLRQRIAMRNRSGGLVLACAGLALSARPAAAAGAARLHRTGAAAER